MPADERALAVVREWIAKAENDLKTATHTLKLGVQSPTDTVCFHAQQCVEKYLKAVLTFHETVFQRTHDIELLVTQLPPGMLVDWPLREQRQLSVYAVAGRYPGGCEPIPLTEARVAVRIAKRIRTQLRHALPPAAYRGLAQPRGRS